MMVEPFGAISVLNLIILDGVCKVTNNILIEKGSMNPGKVAWKWLDVVGRGRKGLPI